MDDVPLRRPGLRADPATPARAPRFRLRTRTVPHGEPREVLAHAVVVATGYFGRPALLGVPGEELPHVSHFFHEGHEAFDRDVVVVGGGNSAVDAALELWRSGARVTIVHFLPELDPNVKPWVRPDIEARMREGSIAARFGVRVARITPHEVVVRADADGAESSIAADHVYAMTGFLPNTGLLERLGVPLDAESGIPAHDPETMETTVPGVFIAGVIASGNHANRIFIENGRDHGRAIAACLTAR
jgi:thioredoxin reductase (NADPH)